MYSMLFHNVTALQKGQAVLTEDALKEKEAAAKGHEAAAAAGPASKSGDRSASAPRSRRAIEPVNTDEVRPIRMVRGFNSCRSRVAYCRDVLGKAHLACELRFGMEGGRVGKKIDFQ